MERFTKQAVAAFAFSMMLAFAAAAADVGEQAYERTMRDAEARHDTRILGPEEQGGATVIAKSTMGVSPAQSDAPYEAAMKDAIARNDHETEPLGMSGGAEIISPETGTGFPNDSAYQAVMRDAIARNDPEYLTGENPGGATLLKR